MSTVHCLRVSAKHSRILQALREESEALFRINVKVVQLGGEPLPPLPERLRRRRSISPRPERPETAASPRTKRAPPASSTRTDRRDAVRLESRNPCRSSALVRQPEPAPAAVTGRNAQTQAR